MYYEFPECTGAYGAASDGSFSQYFLASSDMFVAPVVVAADNTSMAQTRYVVCVCVGGWVGVCVWLP